LRLQFGAITLWILRNDRAAKATNPPLTSEQNQSPPMDLGLPA